LRPKTPADRVLEFHARSYEGRSFVELAGDEVGVSAPHAIAGGKLAPAALGSGARAAAGQSPAPNVPTEVWLARESILERIADQTFSLLRMGRSEAEIHLEPPELGKLRLRLTVSDSNVLGFIEVENPGVRSLLQSDLSSLSSALGEKGLNLSQFDVLLMDEGHRGARRRPDGVVQVRRAAVQDEEQEVPEILSAKAVGGGQLLDYWL
jgi:flagellar hook-length control protein FliK